MVNAKGENMMNLDKLLFKNMQSTRDFSNELVEELRSAITGTSIEEMLSLYAIAKSYYKGDGLIVDVGCGPGGSSFALAKGLEINAIHEKAGPILALDIFDGYCQMIYKAKFDKNRNFESDIDVFTEVTRSVSGFVKPLKTDLTKGFDIHLNGQGIEIAHIDAAKSIELWVGICSTLRHAILPGRTILIFQDFERAKLPFQVYGLRQLLPFGEIIGGSFFGTVYFKVNEDIPQFTWDCIVSDSLLLEEKISLTKEMWDLAVKMIPGVFKKPYETQEMCAAAIAYIYYYGGYNDKAKELYNSLSKTFRDAPENAGFQKDFLD